MSLEIETQKRLRLLTQGLFLSGAVNIIFLILFVYFALSDRSLVKDGLSSIKKSQKVRKCELSNGRYLNTIYDLPFKDLLLLLTSKELLEEGFTRRDLALGCLYTFHCFNLEKALSGQSLQRRPYHFMSKNAQMQTVDLFAGLTDEQFETIIHYGCFEKWPFTTEGLFHLIKKSEKPIDASLLKAFVVSEEFYIIASLFQYQNDFKLTSLQLLDLIRPCSFSFLSHFVKEQKKILEVTKERRELFLMGCLEEGADDAALFLVKGAGNYLLKKATDAQLLRVLSLVKPPMAELYKLSLELIESPRSNAVWQKSAEHLYAFAHEQLPEPFSREQVLQRFVYKQNKPSHFANAEKTYFGAKPAVAKVDSQKSEISHLAHPEKLKSESKPSALKTIFQKIAHKPVTYVVQPGDSLWKIAHKYKVKIAQLTKANNLKNSQLKPGQKLIIPKA